MEEEENFPTLLDLTTVNSSHEIGMRWTKFKPGHEKERERERERAYDVAYAGIISRKKEVVDFASLGLNVFMQYIFRSCV